MEGYQDDQGAKSDRSDRPDDPPRTLRDGQKRLVGVIDGFATYYDTRRHRIDVRLERFDGTHYVTGYYQLQDTESVAEYVRRAEAHGADCGPLSRWVEQRLQPGHSFTVGRLREVRDRIGRVVRAVDSDEPSSEIENGPGYRPSIGATGVLAVLSC